MSFDALAWAGKATPGSAPRKLVLLALADRHNTEDGMAWPSIKWLAEWTDLNRKTIITALQDLESAGFITDSGERKGVTKQVKAYRLNIGTVPKAEQSQKRNSSEKSREQSQKRDTDTIKEPVSSEAKASSPREAFIIPDDIPAEPFAAFVAMRKSLKKPMNDHAKHLAVLKLRRLRDEDGWPPGEVLDHSTLNSYQGLFPPKDRSHDRPKQHPGLGKTASAIASLGPWDDQRPM